MAFGNPPEEISNPATSNALYEYAYERVWLEEKGHWDIDYGELPSLHEEIETALDVIVNMECIGKTCRLTAKHHFDQNEMSILNEIVESHKTAAGE